MCILKINRSVGCVIKGKQVQTSSLTTEIVETGTQTTLEKGT